MKIKKQTLRKCSVTGNSYPKNELIRFAKDKNNQIKFDPDHKLGGRGGYCKNNAETIEIFFKKKLLNKAFRTNIENKVHEEMKEEVSAWLKNKQENQI
ncbi:YlxR family protein [Mycoplasma phocoenae]|uniref:YlxR family protein n=1 Tax=Mycoplasma phocoenae TaxID=754517 RepID=UPI001F16C351|nr:YlxR family protein [Mycoplasma phocoenae]